jgi:hypothetical protein
MYVVNSKNTREERNLLVCFTRKETIRQSVSATELSIRAEQILGRRGVSLFGMIIVASLT